MSSDPVLLFMIKFSDIPVLYRKTNGIWEVLSPMET